MKCLNFWTDPYGLKSNSKELGEALRDPPGENHAAHHIVMTGTNDSRMNDIVDQVQTHGIDPDGEKMEYGCL